MRSGHTLIEVLAALVVAGVFLAGLAVLLTAFARGAGEVVQRTDEAQAVRVIWSILDEEVAAGVAGLDWEIEGERAIRLRAYRGIAIVTGVEVEPGRWPVTWTGHRAPNPDIDSLRVLTDEGEWREAELRWVGGSGEGQGILPDGRTAIWEWEEVGAAPVLVRYFERGRYSLEDGAFRYRRGSGPRQPLTPEILHSRSGVTDEGEVELHFVTGGTARWRIR
jgi:prepilin-type N-terminal cleavage/methylation domain-containing protein